MRPSGSDVSCCRKASSPPASKTGRHRRMRAVALTTASDLNPGAGRSEVPAEGEIPGQSGQAVLGGQRKNVRRVVVTQPEEGTGGHSRVVASRVGDARSHRGAQVVQIPECESTEAPERMYLVRRLDDRLVPPEQLVFTADEGDRFKRSRVCLRRGGTQAVTLVLDGQRQISATDPSLPVEARACRGTRPGPPVGEALPRPGSPNFPVIRRRRRPPPDHRTRCHPTPRVPSSALS